MKIEISFDDGLRTDLRAARLLKEYGFKGTFYIPSAEFASVPHCSLKEVKEGLFNEGMELGGHTVSHNHDMKSLPDDKLKFEIENNKAMIEGLLTGYKRITKFCYPRGRHDERVRAAVKAAGFLEARTTRVLKIKNDTGDHYQTPTTIHMFPRNEYEGLDWLDLAKEYFEQALITPDSFFSLWGHTNELDLEPEGWQKFEEILAYMRGKLSTQVVANVAN